MSDISYNQMNEPIPQAIPVVERHSFVYSFTNLFGAIATGIGASVFWINTCKDAIDKIKQGESTEANILLACVCIGCIGCITYSSLGHKIVNKLAVPIYTPESLSNPSVCSNIVSRFQLVIGEKWNLLNNISRGFQSPNLTPDLVEVLNKILIAMYGTFETILNRLERIEDKVDTNRLAINENGRNIQRIEAKVDNLEAKVDNMSDQIHDIAQTLNNINDTLSRFAFVVAP